MVLRWPWALAALRANGEPASTAATNKVLPNVIVDLLKRLRDPRRVGCAGKTVVVSVRIWATREGKPGCSPVPGAPLSGGLQLERQALPGARPVALFEDHAPEIAVGPADPSKHRQFARAELDLFARPGLVAAEQPRAVGAKILDQDRLGAVQSDD
jgi:hypothetical protein